MCTTYGEWRAARGGQLGRGRRVDRDDPPATATGAPGEGADEQLLSIGEAALRYGVPARKINKLVYENQLDGARKVRGAHGMEWRVPAAELETRGFHRQDEPHHPVPSEVSELQRAVRLLTDSLVRERQRWADKQRELEAALLQVGELRGQLRREQLRRQRVEQELDARAPTPPAADTPIDLRTSQEQSARQG